MDDPEDNNFLVVNFSLRSFSLYFCYFAFVIEKVKIEVFKKYIPFLDKF